MRTARYLIGLMCLVLAASFPAQEQAVGQFASAARWVPESANCLVMIQAKRIFDSQLSKKNGWRDDHLQRFRAGVAYLPVSIDRILLSAQLDLDSTQPLWKVSVFEGLGTEIDMAKVSERYGGNLEKVAGRSALVLPNDSYLVKIDATTMASMVPANRQSTGRWLASKASPTVTLSPYLKKAMNFADKNADVIMALDVEHTIDPEVIKQRIKLAGIVTNDADVDPVAAALSSLEGAMLGVTINDDITGSLRFDFGSNPAILEKYAKAAFLTAMARRGAAIDDLDDWSISISGNTITMVGKLTETGLRKTLSIVPHSIENDLAFQSPGDAQNVPEVSIATRSKQYFGKLESIFDELTKRPKTDKALNTFATWFERYARDIDEISVVDVDPDLVTFGQKVADSFRDTASVLRNAQLTKRSSMAGMGDSFYSERYGAYGNYSYWYDNSAARRAIGTQQDVAGEKAAREILQGVSAEMSSIRRDLSQKYKIDF
jgi:hypothetical protein